MCGLISLYPLNKALLKPLQKNEYTGANRKNPQKNDIIWTNQCVLHLVSLHTHNSRL